MTRIDWERGMVIRPDGIRRFRYIRDTDAVCITCRWKGDHAPDCAHRDLPWPKIAVEDPQP